MQSVKRIKNTKVSQLTNYHYKKSNKCRRASLRKHAWTTNSNEHSNIQVMRGNQIK